MQLKQWTATAAGALTTLVVGAAQAAVQPEAGIGYPKDVSLDGHRIDWLINITGVFCSILFVIMCAWIFTACAKHGRNHTAEYDHGNGKHSVTVALAVSAIIFLVVDGNLFITSMIDLSEAFWNWDIPKNNPDTVRIEVNGHQWAWDARYPGPDGQFNTDDDIITLNDIRIPVDTPIFMQFGSVDVIHSFYLPNLRMKQDATPSMINPMWFQATETGEFDIACAQHCGTHHYKMKGKLTILDKEDYAAWASHASELAKRAYNPDDLDSHWGWAWKEI